MDVRILVVDDESSLHCILREIFECRGADVHVTDSGENAVRMWDHALHHGIPFQIVITDLALGPGLNGFQLAKYIRSTSVDVRILVCTGSSADPVVAAPGAYGFDGCVTKPFLLQDLLDAVAGVMVDN